MDSYLDDINAILDIHALYKKISKYKLRFKLKPWITLEFQESISVKNSLKNSQTVMIPNQKNTYILDIKNIEKTNYLQHDPFISFRAFRNLSYC